MCARARARARVSVCVCVCVFIDGPDSVSINGPQQPFDTDGTKDMSFTCTANNFRPGVRYQWRRLSDGSSSNGNSYTVQNVGETDDGTVFQCTASNTKFSSSLQASQSVTLDLHCELGCDLSFYRLKQEQCHQISLLVYYLA